MVDGAGERHAGEGVAAGQRVVPGRGVSDPWGIPNGKRDTDIRNIGLQLLLRSSGRIGNGPAVLDTPNSGADHAPSAHETDSEVPPILPSILAGLTDSERRTHLIHLLDQAREAYIAARAMRVELMVLARDNGVSCRDIGTVLGISEQSARAQISRTKAKGGASDGR